jgi:hypothetical protein
MEQGNYLAAAPDALGRIAESQQDALERAAGTPWASKSLRWRRRT